MIDATDKKILNELQLNARITTKDLASKLGLSTTPVFERIKKLEKSYNVKLAVVDKSFSGASFCIREDELSTGGTAALAAEHLVNDIKAFEVFFCGTHAVCADGWKRKIIDRNIFDNIFLGNTIPRGYFNSTGGQITTVDLSHQIAQKVILVVRKL